MSSEYVLNIKLKDPQGLFQQIKNLEQNGIGGKVAAASGGGGFFNKKLGDLNLGMLAKLTGIGFGIHQLVQLGIKSSGILQGTMKMWESSIMLMIKPIADFIGLMLRPVTVMFLTQFIIPFYKTVYPWFRDAGKVAGNVLQQGFDPTHKPLIADLSFENMSKQLTNFTGQVGLTFAQFYIDLSRTLTSIPGIFFSLFVNIGTGIWTSLSAIGGIFYSLFINIGTGIWQSLSNLGGIFYGLLVNIGESIWSALTGIPGLILGVFESLAKSLGEALAAIPKMIWDALTGWIPGIGGGGGSSNPPTRWSGGGGSRTTVSAIADTLR